MSLPPGTFDAGLLMFSSFPKKLRSVGKMNAFSFEMIERVNKALDECQDAGAVVLTGNSKVAGAHIFVSFLSLPSLPQPVFSLSLAFLPVLLGRV